MNCGVIVQVSLGPSTFSADDGKQNAAEWIWIKLQKIVKLTKEYRLINKIVIEY